GLGDARLVRGRIRGDPVRTPPGGGYRVRLRSPDPHRRPEAAGDEWARGPQRDPGGAPRPREAPGDAQRADAIRGLVLPGQRGGSGVRRADLRLPRREPARGAGRQPLRAGPDAPRGEAAVLPPRARRQLDGDRLQIRVTGRPSTRIRRPLAASSRSLLYIIEADRRSRNTRSNPPGSLRR